jgi:hypothetical protein
MAAPRIQGHGLDRPLEPTAQWVSGWHRDVAGLELDRGCPHPGGELAFGVGRDHLVVFGYQKPGGQRFPGRRSHHVVECGQGKGLLHGMHDPGLGRIDIGREMVEEIVLGQPGVTLLVGNYMRDRRRRRSLRKQRPDRFALIEAEPGDVNNPDDVGGVRAQRCHDLAAVRMSGQDSRAVLHDQHLTEPRNVIRQRAERELRCGDVISVRLQPLDDATPTGTVGPSAVYEDDVRFCGHVGPFVNETFGTS